MSNYFWTNLIFFSKMGFVLVSSEKKSLFCSFCALVSRPYSLTIWPRFVLTRPAFVTILWNPLFSVDCSFLLVYNDLYSLHGVLCLTHFLQTYFLGDYLHMLLAKTNLEHINTKLKIQTVCTNVVLVIYLDVNLSSGPCASSLAHRKTSLKLLFKLWPRMYTRVHIVTHTSYM